VVKDGSKRRYIGKLEGETSLDFERMCGSMTQASNPCSGDCIPCQLIMSIKLKMWGCGKARTGSGG